jgi:6-phosphogluconolactonase
MEKVTVFSSHEAMYASLVELIDNVLGDRPAINISLSGGSTPKAFFDYWAEAKRDAGFWNRIRLFWGDERCVPPDSELSNYGMTLEHLLGKVPVPAENIFRIRGENDPDTEALRYGELIDKEATPFDLIMLGLGDDGHTVSIFPSSIDLWDSRQTCIVNSHPDNGIKRVTITGKVINGASHVAFLATGYSKADKVREIVKNNVGSSYIYPAARVKPESGNIYWLLDEEAASLL